MRKLTYVLVAALALAGGGVVAAQESGAQSKEQPAARALTPLKLQLTITRMQGEKKVSSVPYVLWLTANDRNGISVRVGNSIPIASKDGYSYRDVGTNIDSNASSAPEGAFQISLTIQDSSVYYPDRNDPATASSTNTGMPAFRSFSSRFSIVLRDGQTAPYISAADPVTGQVLKIEATLNVLR